MTSDSSSESGRDLERRKEVKVKIPLGFHLKLHSMKVITGQHISDTVTEALQAYFDDGDGDVGELAGMEDPLEFLQG